jgi:hypothetical protein
VLIGTGGASAPLSAAGRTMLKKMGANAVKQMSKSTVRPHPAAVIISLLTSTIRTCRRGVYRAGVAKFKKAATKKAMKQFAKENIREAAEDGWTENTVKALCNGYGYQYYADLSTNPSAFNPASLDPTGIANAVTSCEGSKSAAVGTALLANSSRSRSKGTTCGA